jgi:hypothetical protein
MATAHGLAALDPDGVQQIMADALPHPAAGSGAAAVDEPSKGNGKAADNQACAKQNGKFKKPALGPAVNMEILQTMTFKPIKYVVPVLVEGLTLLAASRRSKSWLLRMPRWRWHGGFTR